LGKKGVGRGGKGELNSLDRGRAYRSVTRPKSENKKRKEKKPRGEKHKTEKGEGCAARNLPVAKR